MKKSLETPVRYLKGIGPKRAKSLKKARIYTIEDFLYNFPSRYEDRTNFTPVSKLQEGQIQTIKAEILARVSRTSFRRRGFSIIEVAVGDETGKLFCVWFNQPYLKEYFKVGESLILYGKVEHYGKRLQMNSPEFEIIEEDEKQENQGLSPKGTVPDSLSTGRIVPIYTLPEKMSQRSFRKIIKTVSDEYLPIVNDFLPYDIRSRNDLLNLAKSIINMHFPESADIQKQAYRRLAFEEFFVFQLPLVLRKLKKKEKTGIAHKVEGELADNFIDSLTFRLTDSQQRVIEEIKQDMHKPQGMQRLLQGDVGSGKTVVATIACVIAIQGKYQVAFMVPTEILARQHYEKISSQLSALSSQLKIIKTCLLTSSSNV